jgi:hypothetical protein
LGLEAHEAAERIREAAEGKEAAEQHERFRIRAALVVAVLAALLAISSVLGLISIKDEINANVDATDYHATLNARRLELRQVQLAINDYQEQLAEPDLDAGVRSLLQQHMQDDQADAKTLQSDPEGGEGIDQLQENLNDQYEEQTTSETRGDSFHASEALFEIAIVIASVAILILNAPMLYSCIGLGGVALLVLLNGYIQLIHF